MRRLVTTELRRAALLAFTPTAIGGFSHGESSAVVTRGTCAGAYSAATGANTACSFLSHDLTYLSNTCMMTRS